MRRLLQASCVLAALGGGHMAYACGIDTPEYKQGRNDFYGCFGKRLQTETNVTTTQKFAEDTTHNWCETELHHWYEASHDGCNEAERSEQEKAQGYGIFQAETATALSDMLINAAKQQKQ